MAGKAIAIAIVARKYFLHRSGGNCVQVNAVDGAID
jgi:hypothetical protein